MKALAAIAMLVVVVSPSSAESMKQPVERRCAFLGRFGSFTVIGSKGVAAYQLSDGQYIADLEAAGDDPNWWLYRPVSNGDATTTMWAFARKPHRGLYKVLRFANGRWKLYECTNAWGRGLGESGAALASTNVEIIDELRAIREKLDLIQPRGGPSLLDIQNTVEGTKPR